MDNSFSVSANAAVYNLRIFLFCSSLIHFHSNLTCKHSAPEQPVLTESIKSSSGLSTSCITTGCPYFLVSATSRTRTLRKWRTYKPTPNRNVPTPHDAMLTTTRTPCTQNNQIPHHRTAEIQNGTDPWVPRKPVESPPSVSHP